MGRAFGICEPNDLVPHFIKILNNGSVLFTQHICTVVCYMLEKVPIEK